MDISMPTAEPKIKRPKLNFERMFTTAGKDPLDSIEWVVKDAVIRGSGGKEKFRQNGVEVPSTWEDNTIAIVAEKYFRVIGGIKENSARQMFSRVASWMAVSGVDQGVFDSDVAEIFYDELLYLLVNGMYAFNSPVWFNVGVQENPQCSACFIQSVDDTMESIVSLQRNEVMLFKGGSGTGSNLSNLRSSWEPLSRGGYASGPVSFMRGYDSWAGVTKSGGGTRRAAKLSCLNMDHPDILEQMNGMAGFITCKSDAEQQAHALYSTGKYSAEFNVAGNVYDRTWFQNANHSVRVTDDFMQAVSDNKNWNTVLKNGEIHRTYPARRLFDAVSEAAWVCGDPGIQFDTATNKMHTCPSDGRINASNPCSEYLFLDDTACFTGETRISTPHGLRRIADLFQLQQADFSILITTDVHSDVDSRQLTAYRRAIITQVGQKPVVRMILKDGRSIRVTDDHKFLTEYGWKQVKDLNIDEDRLLLRQGGDPVIFNSSSEEVARWQLLGWLTGDGVFSKDNTSLVFGPDEINTAKVLEGEFQRLIKDAGGNVNRLPHLSTQTNGVIQITSQSLVLPGYLEGTYGMHQGTAIYKDVPAKIHAISNDLKIAYLQGLFSADGSIMTSGTEPMAMLASSAPDLLRSVQLLLSDLGIISSISWIHPSGRKNPQGQLRIYNQQARKFFSLIGMPLSEKKSAKIDIILSRPFLGELKNPRPTKIVSIEADGVEMVYDVTEPVTHTLIAEGIVAHNCNLGSLNLMKFLNANGKFVVGTFKHAVDIVITAKEIIVDASSYPTAKIAENSRRYRTLGLGFTNLGALLTFWGLPYDSDEGRKVTGAISSVMGGQAYLQSARLAAVQGPFQAYEANRVDMLNVITRHRAAVFALRQVPTKVDSIYSNLFLEADHVWIAAYDLGKDVGFRNAQTTVIAPTGTISFLMGADTTGIEPMLGVVTYKKAIGEGFLTIPNSTISPALIRLGYSTSETMRILQHIVDKHNIHTAPDFKKEHSPIFAEALGEWALRPEAHVDMMAAVQPFISGGISKTVNMPNKATKEDIAEIYTRAWNKGLKCVAVYRDGCKMSQPISTKVEEKKVSPLLWGSRKKLPKTREGKTHSFRVGDVEGYLTANVHPDGTLGEIFVRMSKQGSFVGGIVDSFAINFSMALQSGTPLDSLVDKFKGTRFEPSGFTGDTRIPIATSILDYIVRWLELEFLKPEQIDDTKTPSVATKASIQVIDLSGNPCRTCGGLTKRTGSCYTCTSCGDTTGCG